MPNTLIPAAERNLTPAQIDQIDKRRVRGLMLFVLSTIFAIVSVVLLLWLGQDVTYGPGWARPIVYYFILTVSLCIITGGYGYVLRRGATEF